MLRFSKHLFFIHGLLPMIQILGLVQKLVLPHVIQMVIWNLSYLSFQAKHVTPNLFCIIIKYTTSIKREREIIINFKDHSHISTKYKFQEVSVH